ncbi:MAG: hypothetical protein R2748_24050 [Bryobacterales bacterium]
MALPNLPDLFQPSLVGRAARAGFEFAGEARTFGELDAVSNSLADYLLREGLAPGDRVAVYLENRPGADHRLLGGGEGRLHLHADQHPLSLGRDRPHTG